ncbi:cupin-like domain-containing protein [Sorangium sp. So ce124]|uniref:cupin-like domain-containing protein n=1 Tax=Sorangium sp. So ce124 TaxID=3133280 RepID=UPI003F5E8AC0
MFENVPRVDSLSYDAFISEYAVKGRPVIVTDLFAGEPIRELDTLESARAALGRTRVCVHNGYEHYFTLAMELLFGRPRPGSLLERRPSTVDEYLRGVERRPESREIASEVPEDMVPELCALYRVPPYCLNEAGERDDYVSELWLGNAGNHSHLHYDADQRHVLQYQIFGAKRAILIPPSEGTKLGPISNNCVVSPEGVPDADRDEFVRFTGGYQCMLRAGEALLIPALMWHYFEYVETSMALTMRFRRNRYARFFGDRLHFDYRLQAIAWRFLDERAITPELEGAFAEVEQAYWRPSVSPIEKGEELQQVFDRLYERLCAPASPGTYSRPFLEVVRRSVRHLETEGRKLYRSSTEEDAHRGGAATLRAGEALQSRSCESAVDARQEMR